MSKILGIITAVIMVVTALLALKNKSAYQDELAEIKKEERREESTKEDLATEKQRVSDAEDLIVDYKDQKEVAEAKLEETESNLAEAKDELVSLEQEHKSNEPQIEEFKVILASLPNPGDLVPKVKGMRTELAALTDDIAVQEARLTALATKEAAVKVEVSKVRDIIGLQSTGGSYATMKTRVSSVYPDLGFVILAAGDKQGVVSGSVLDVVRDSEVIGKLKVTAVEAGRSSANIVLNSFQEGTSIQTGDSVRAENKNEVVSFQ